MPEITTHWERCYSFTSMFIGSTGGGIIGYFTKTFDPKRPVNKLTIEMTSESLKKHKYLVKLRRLQIGGNMYWRIGTQVFCSMMMYSFLECRFKGGWPRRSSLDVAFAGAITGGAFGLRGIPGGKVGAGYGAAGFAIYATVIHLIFC